MDMMSLSCYPQEKDTKYGIEFFPRHPLMKAAAGIQLPAGKQVQVPSGSQVYDLRGPRRTALTSGDALWKHDPHGTRIRPDGRSSSIEGRSASVERGPDGRQGRRQEAVKTDR